MAIVVKYSVDWLNQTEFKGNKDLRVLVYRRHKLIEPKCGCYGKRIYNKIKYKKLILELEDQIDEFIGA